MAENSVSTREQFKQEFDTHIKREGADKLWAYLEKSDFFTAPASSKFHGACAGGLVAHSLAVYRNLKRFQTNESDETIAICGLLHDLCKTNFYKLSKKNVKNAEGKWEEQPFYTIEDTLCYGHGEASVYILSSYIRLSREEALAIRWHMGGFDCAVKGGERAISGAYENYPLCAKLACADMLATYVNKL